MSKINIPKLRFKEFSGEWEDKNYGDIYSFYSTNSLSRDKLNYKDGEVYNIHYGDIHTKFSTMFKLENEYVPFINNEIDLSKIKEENYCQIGDLVIADASEDYEDIGKTIEIISLNKKRILAGLHTFLARPNKEYISLGFIAYLLQNYHIKKQIMKIAQGTKVLSLSTKRLSNVKLNLPQKQEQQKIASFLTTVDKKIEQLTKKAELQEQYKKGVMGKIFKQEIRFKNDDGSEFEEWKEKKLKELAIRSTTKNKDSSINNVLTNSATFGIINQTDYFDKGIANQNNLEGYYVVKTNDFIYNPRISNHAPVGPMKRNKLSVGIMSPLYTVFRFKKINLDFIEYYFNSPLWHKYMYHIANYGARHDRMNITNNDFLKMPINIPQKQEQTKIANFLSLLDKKIDSTKEQLSKTKEFKKGLLQNMFV